MHVKLPASSSRLTQRVRPSAPTGIVADVASRDHGDPGDAPTMPPPLGAITDPTRPTAAEEARTIAAATNAGTLASLTAAGDPWASFVTYGLLQGAPVLCVSLLAEHGRNLAADPRASLAVVAPGAESDPLPSSTGPSVRGLGVLSASVQAPNAPRRRTRASHTFPSYTG
jgi:hypothetical protein